MLRHGPIEAANGVDCEGDLKCFKASKSCQKAPLLPQETRAAAGAPLKWGCFYAEKEMPTNAENSFVMAGHGYGLPVLPAAGAAAAAGQKCGFCCSQFNF